MVLFMLSAPLQIIVVALESGDTGHIHYDDKAVESLLNRTRQDEEEGADDDSTNLMANEYLASFKVSFTETFNWYFHINNDPLQTILFIIQLSSLSLFHLYLPATESGD